MAVRKAPEPNGRPGFLRVDTVHMGDKDGRKGVHVVNMVDEVTQYEHVGALPGISERFMVPLLEALLPMFPFDVLGFHADNGSEYVNHRVAALLNKLHVGEFTKSRPRHSNDNALVEGKNAHVVRKHLGHEHIPIRFAGDVDIFAREHLSPFLNFHRPCLFATERTDAKGKVRRTCRREDVATPPAKLKSLPDAASFLRTARASRPSTGPPPTPAWERTTAASAPANNALASCACAPLNSPDCPASHASILDILDLSVKTPCGIVVRYCAHSQ